MQGCSAFIESLLSAADCAKISPKPARAGTLARQLVEDFVPEMRVYGVDLRGWIAPGAGPPRIAADERWDISGFKGELIAGGQRDEALRHLAAAAAAVLGGRRMLVWAASVVDWAQGLSRSRRRESSAERADNRAGVALGHLLREYLHDRISRAALRERAQALLCREDEANSPP